VLVRPETAEAPSGGEAALMAMFLKLPTCSDIGNPAERSWCRKAETNLFAGKFRSRR